MKKLFKIQIRTKLFEYLLQEQILTKIKNNKYE